MLHFILSCVLLLSIVFWWAEVKFNYLYAILETMNKSCEWIKKQTRLNIDICRILPLFIVIGLVVALSYFLLDKLYFPYFESVLDLKSDNISLKSDEKSDTSLIANWGTFGDFIGGTLNPILTFISICLILYTVYQNKKALDFNSEELSLSRKAQQDSSKSQNLIQKTQNLQQFDSLFFSLLNQFKHQQDKLLELNENDKSKVDIVYRDVFVNDYEIELEDKRYKLMQKQEFNQYFICLFQLFKLINTKINRSPNETDEIKEWGDYTLEKQYINILRSIIPPKLQQLLFLNTYTEFDEYRWYLSYYSFLKHMPFKNLERGDELCIDLLVISKFYELDGFLLNKEFQIFGKSIYFNNLLNKSCYSEFLESNELFFGSWEFVENKFLNFNEIVCYFKPDVESELNEEEFYEVILIKKNENDLTVSFGIFNQKDQAIVGELRNRRKIKFNYIRFSNIGFNCYVDADLTLYFSGIEHIFITREKNKVFEQAEDIDWK